MAQHQVGGVPRAQRLHELLAWRRWSPPPARGTVVVAVVFYIWSMLTDLELHESTGDVLRELGSPVATRMPFGPSVGMVARAIRGLSSV